MPIDEFTLDEEKKSQLDKNIRLMIEEGVDEEGVMNYAKDFKNKFGKKKIQNPFLESNKPFSQGIGESVKLPSQSKSPSTSTTTTTTTTAKPKVEKPIQLQQRPKSNTPDFVSPQEITRQLTELGQAPYDEVKERNRIQNGSQGLKKAQVKASEQLLQRDELMAQVEEAKIALEQAKADPQAYNALVPQYNELLKQVNQVTDNIKGELAKIDIYEKGIGATQLKMSMNEDSGDARWQYGVNEAKQILLQTLPTTARYMGYFAARTRGIPADMAEKVSTDLVEQNFGGIVDAARQLAAENEELQEVFTKESAWEAIKEGDMTKTADLAAKELAQTLPATLALMATYLNPYVGATATVMGTAGTELESMEDENMSPDAKMANALVKGGLEYATEKIFGTIPMVKRAIGAKSKAGQEALQNVVLETWNKYAKKMGFGADVIEEVGSEMLNTIGGNYTDYLTGKTDDLQLLKDIGKTFTTSLSMAALLSGGARAMKYGNKDIDKLREDTKKLKEIAASQEVTPEVLEVIQENIIANNEKIGDESEKEKKVFDSMTEEEWDEATALIQENQSLQEQIEAGEVQPEILPLVEKKIEENEAQVDAIKEEVKLTLEQRIEALNKLKQQENATQERNIEQSNITEREGITEQQQGGQENRVNQEEPITTAEAETSSGNRAIESGQVQEEVKPIKIKNPLKLNSEEIGLVEMEGEKPSDKYSVRQFFSKEYDDIAVPRIGHPKFEPFLEENKPNTKETEVLISDITPTQAVLDKKGIGGKLTEGNPIAVRFKGSKEIYLLDGHHRTSTEVAKGNKKIKLDLIDIDKTMDDYENDKYQKFLNDLEARDKQKATPQNVPLIDKVNNTEVVEPQDQKRSEKVEEAPAKSPFDLVAEEEKAYKQKQEDAKKEAKNDIELINSDNDATIEKYFKKSRYKELPDGKGYYFDTGASRIIKRTKKQVALDTAENIVKKKPLGLPQSRVEEIVKEFEANKKQPQVEAQEPILSESTPSESKTKIEDEKTNQKEDGEPMLGELPTNRSKEQGGKASTELREGKEEIKPIRQLGSGSNVYFETDKYRVNESKDGGFLLNIQNQKDPVAIANIKFNNASDAVTIAKEVDRIYPNGVPDAVLIDKFIDGLKKELLGGKEKPQEVKPKKKTKRVGSNKAINKLSDPQSKRDFIALALFNNYISIDSFNKANDKNNLKVGSKEFPSVRMNYLRKNGMSINELVDNLMRDKVAFPFEVTADELLKEITNFMFDNPNGPNSYAVKMLNTPDPQQEYFDMKFAEYEQQLAEEKLLEEATFAELELAWDKIESDVEALTEAEIAEIEQLMATDQQDLINQVIEKNNENIRAEERKNQAVSKGESGTKSDKRKERASLEEEVKKAKSKVDSANVALSKARAKMATAAAEYQRNIFGTAEAESKLFPPNLKAIKKDIEQKEIDVAKAKEAQEKAIAKLDAFVEENQQQLDFTEKAIEALEKLKADTKGKMNAFGIAPAAWNAVIDTLIGGIRAGRVISELVQEAVKTLKDASSTFDEKAFKDMLIEGGVATKEEIEGVAEQVEEEPNVSEEVPPIEPPKPPKGDKGEGMTPSEGMEISKHYKTVMANTTLEDLSSSLDQIDFEYKPVSMESDREAAMAYLQKNGIERSLLNLASRNIEGLTKSEEIQLAALLYASLNKAMREALAAGNRELANAIFNEAKPLTRVTTKLGTDYGRAVNAFKAFALDFSDPVTAAFNLEKAVEEANKIEMEKASNKTNAKSTANSINNEVKKGKKKTVKEVVKTLNEELYGQITKGGKGLTTEQKAKIKNIFNEFKVDTTTLKSANPIKAIAAGLLTPKVYNAFIEKVGDLSVEGISLGVAMTRVSAEFLRNKIGSPKELAEARKALNEQVNGLKTKKEPTKAQLERKAASEELKEEIRKFNAEKEIADYKEKQAKKAESLREKDAKKVLQEVEKLELQRAQQLAKEATELEEELRKDRKRIADLKAKEETDRQDRIAKLELQRANIEAKEASKERDKAEKEKAKLSEEIAKEKLRLKEFRESENQQVLDAVAKLELQRAQEKLKETEKAIKELTSEIQKNDADLVAEILDEYLSLEGDAKTNNQKLIDMVKDKLSVSDAQAKVIATKIAQGVATNIKAKLETKFGNQLSEEEKAAKKAGAKPKANPLDDLIRAANLGITPELVMDFFKNKYGIKEVTIDDIQAIQELAKSVAAAPTKSRRGVLLGKIQDMLNSKKNKTTAELLTNLWHARVLSSVFLGVFGTGDTNVTYNLLTLALNTAEYPITIGVRAVKEVKSEIVKRIKGGKIDKKIIRDIAKNAVLDITNGALKSIGQTIVYDEKEIKSMEIFLSALKNTKYLQQSLSYLKTASIEGSNFKKEYDNPFKATAGTTFDLANYISLFKKAENGDKDAQARIVQMVRKVTNAYVNGVTNILSGQDLFFGSFISNAYMIPLMREQLEKEGLSEKEINKEIINRIFNTKVEYENARRMAIKNRMQYDITFELKVNEAGEAVYIIKDKGKDVKEGTFSRTPKQFETKQDAIDYAVEKVAPSGNAFKNDTIDILNEKIGTEIQTKADKVAQNELLSADVEGGTRYLMQLSNNILGALEQVSTFLNEYSKEVSMYDWSELGAMAKDLDPMAIPRIIQKVISEAINFVSVMFYSLRNMLAYLRVGLNALRNQSSYIAPIGLWRYYRSMTNKNMGAFGKLTYEISETERNKILSKALLGAYFTYVGSVLPLLLSGGDDEEEKEVKKRFANWYKETTGEELKGEQKNFFLNLKAGQAIGTLEWMTPAQQKFYKRTGLIVENSTFDGFGEDGKPIYSTIKNRPQFAGASLVSTYQLIQAFGDEEQKEEWTAVWQAAKTPLYQWKDMSIGQGGISLLFSNMKAGDIAKKVAQSAILDNFEVLNPSVVRVGLQMVDTKMRRNDDLFTALENEATVAGGVRRWMFNRILPVYAGYNQAMKAPQIYGMFGEELYRVPAESQGLVGSTIAKYVNSGKNIEEKNMYVFLDDNGYKKIWEWNKNIPIFLPTKVGAEPQLLTRDEIDKYGRIAGRKTLEELKTNLSKLSLIRNNASVSDEDAQKDFNKYVDEMFKKNFRIAYFEANKAFEGNTETAIENIQERFDTKINEDYNQIKSDIEDGVTALSEEDLLLKKAFRNNIESAIKYFSEMESGLEIYDEIKRLVKLKVLTDEQGKQIKKTLLN
jgi:hypothetical protein